MRRTTIMVIPEGTKSTQQIEIPNFFIRIIIVASFGLVSAVGFIAYDYYQLRNLREGYYRANSENEGLKGEARILMSNLEEVKRSLSRVHDYTSKLGELTAVRVESVTKKTGIGPLTEEEYEKSQIQDKVAHAGSYIPLGVEIDKLTFRPVFDRLDKIGQTAEDHALQLQKLLSTLGQQKSLLSSIPTIAPVNGWITSGFGYRISPFTGKRTLHQGIDIAAAIGTPIAAPADGVVIFSGAKAGFGNFIMIAHGYGIVTRYGHNAQNMVQPGQKVTRGDQIGTVGMTGRATGSHTHFEVVVNGQIENPRKFFLDSSEIKALAH